MKLIAAFSGFSLLAINSASAQPHRQSAAENNAGALIAVISFGSGSGPAILIPVKLNGGETDWWALDSGSSECIVDRAIAGQAPLVMRGGRELSGTGKGTVHLDSIRSPVSLQLDGKSLQTCTHFGALDLHGLVATGGNAISGILGYEFFSRYIVRIDFAAHRLALYDPAKYRYEGNGDTLQLHFDGKRPRVEVRIRTARRPEVIRHLLIDTGSEDAVDDSAVRRSPGGPAITVNTTGLGVSYPAAIGTLDTVRIGHSVFTNVPGVASDIGIVGNGIWSRFICVFDYAHKRLIIEPPAKASVADSQMGPRVISRPSSPEAPEYYVELKPEFDQVKYSAIIASRAGGKVGYIYHNFHGFSIHTLPDSIVAKIRLMPEVSAVVKSTVFHLD
jgi:hypothetical protein